MDNSFSNSFSLFQLKIVLKIGYQKVAHRKKTKNAKKYRQIVLFSWKTTILNGMALGREQEKVSFSSTRVHP